MPRLLRPLLAAVLLALAGCQTPDPAPMFPDMTFTHQPPVTLDVARIDIVREYAPPLARPNVEHLAPVAPVDAAERWARDRLRASGSPGRHAVVVIRDGRIVETPLRRTGGLQGAFTKDQSERYDAQVEVAVQIRQDRGNYLDAEAVGRATRSITVAEDISPNARARVWYEITEKLMRDFDQAITPEIQRHLARFVVR